jgi:hypothetical protein
MLEHRGVSMLELAISGFRDYFASETFVFIHRDEGDVAAFIERAVERRALADPRLVPLSQMTSGQAESVVRGLEGASVGDDEWLVVFNIDSVRRRFDWPTRESLVHCDGWLEVFPGSGPQWSYARTEKDGDRVLESVEKREISSDCSNGLYTFRRAGDFRSAYENLGASGYAETFVAPLYNDLIARGRDIRVRRIDADDVAFCGVPEDWERFCREPPAWLAEQL